MAFRRKRIWITRAQPGAEATAERVRGMGHEALVAPLLAVRRLPDVRVDLEGVAALAFTSANAVRVFAELSGERKLRVYAVGAATAHTARQAGFASVLSADGGVEALARGVASRRSEIKGVVLHPGAAELAGDLVGELDRAGVRARRLALYETVEALPEPDQAAGLLDADVVLLHSPKAARVLAGLLRAQPAPQLRAIGLSREVLKPLSRIHLAGKSAPAHPLEGALLQLIDKERSSPSGGGGRKAGGG
jgi:uroporphyrinogen-III synthase